MYTENIWNNADLETEFCCAYLVNSRDESFHILRICGTNLYVY
jgi:hypothetical protein